MADGAACRTGIYGQLMKKRDEPRLWMELYQGVADTRRVECFLTHAAALPACDNRP